MTEMDKHVPDLIKNFELDLLDPVARRSTSKVNDLLADDFKEIGQSGAHYTKQDILNLLSKARIIRYSMSDFHAQEIAPETILVTYKVEGRTVEDESSRFSVRSSIWQRRNSAWKLIFHQGTPLRQ